jgi:hypothetical protein
MRWLVTIRHLAVVLLLLGFALLLVAGAIPVGNIAKVVLGFAFVLLALSGITIYLADRFLSGHERRFFK